MATQKIRYDIEAAVSGGSEVNALASSLEGLAGTLEGDLKTQALASAAALRQLGEKQGAIDTFRRLKTEVQTAAVSLREAQTAAQQLGQKIAASEAPTRAQTGQLQKLRDSVRAAKTELQQKTVALDQSRGALRTYGVGTDNLAQSERNVRAAIVASKAEVRQLVPAYQQAGQAAATSGRQQAQAATEARSGLKGLADQLRTVQNIAIAALGGSFVGGLVKDVARTADEYNNLAARIKLATGEGEAFERAMTAVTEISLRTNSSLESTGTLFARLTDAGKNAGLGAAAAQAQALSLTETINQAVQVSGASATASDAALTQLIQGLQSGVLRGEEFNSVMEQSPRLARALADGLGVTTGELRKMANQGALTTEVVIGALKSQADTLKTEYATLPPTIGRAIQNLSTSWTVYVGEADKATGASALAARAISALAENLDEIAAFATRAGAVLVVALAVQAAGAVRTYAAEVLAAKTATGLLALEMGKVPKTVQISVAAVGLEIGFRIGEMLRENFALARKLGVGLVGFMQLIVNDLRFLKEAAEAVFTSDTVDAAFDRYIERNKAIGAVIKDMMKDAEKAPEAVTAAADEATKATEQIEKSAKAAGTELKGAATEAKALGSESAAAGAAGAAGLDKIKQEAESAALAAKSLGAELTAVGTSLESLPVKAKTYAEQVAEAFAGAGIKTQAELATLATEAEKRFNLISGSGKATADGLQKAWQQMAEASIAANGGVASETLKAEAAMYGLEIAVDSAGKAIVKKMGDAKTAVDGFAKGVAEAAAQVKRLQEIQGLASAGGDLSGVSTEDLKKAQSNLLKQGGALSSPEYIKLRNERISRQAPTTDKDGFSLDKSGKRLSMGSELATLTGIKNFLQQAGLDEAQAKQVALEFSDSKGDIPYFSNPGQMKYGGRNSTISSALLKAAERTTFAPSPPGALPPGASGSRSVVVELRNGTATERVTTDEAGAAALVRSLKNASLVANG